MTGFELTKKAKSDLKDIAVYTQNTWGKHQRNIFKQNITAFFHNLSGKRHLLVNFWIIRCQSRFC